MNVRTYFDKLKSEIPREARSAYLRAQEKEFGFSRGWSLDIDNQVFDPIRMLAWTSLWLQNKRKPSKANFEKQSAKLTTMMADMVQLQQDKLELEDREQLLTRSLLREVGQAYNGEGEFKFSSRYMCK